MPKISGREAASKRLRALSGKEKVELVGQALFVGGDEIAKYAAHSITEGSVSGAGHVASLPGEPPNADTHVLDRSIYVEQPAPLRVQVIADAPHAVPLEGGTSDMEERPFMGPAARAKKKRVVELVTKAVGIATRKR
jgi:hypothetical protein